MLCKNLINEILYWGHKNEVSNDWNGNEVFNDWKGFSGDSDAKESACNAGGPGSIPGSGRFPGEK